MLVRLALAALLVASASLCAPPLSAPSRGSAPLQRTGTGTATATGGPTATPDPERLKPCLAAQLQAVSAWAEAADGLEGGVFVANRGEPCRLRGNPEIALLADDGAPLDVLPATVTGASGPRAIVVPTSAFAADASGLQGAGAVAPVRWFNYCRRTLPVRFALTLPEAGGRLEGTFIDLAGRAIPLGPTPRCDDGAAPSTLAVYPFQEPRR